MNKLGASSPLFTNISLDRESHVPLYKQLYDSLRNAILTRRLAGGFRLPSTRTLSKELGMSRNTVLLAFEQLIAEGYVEGQSGSGTFVASVLPDEFSLPCSATLRALSDRRPSKQLSRTAEKLGPLAKLFLPVLDNQSKHPGQPFQVGAADTSAFPKQIWGRILASRWRNSPDSLMNYHHPAGYGPLREAIAGYVGASRGVLCAPDQVIVVTGSQQAVSLTTSVLLNSGDSVWIEEPGYLGARAALISAGAWLVPVPVDHEGIDVAQGQALCPDARLVFVTPSHQFPMGVTMSLTRRLALLDWANRSNAWILEDDYDSEFRYSSRPLSALQGLDRNERVIYSGTFSKVLFPGLRLGYLVVPNSLVDAFTSARMFADMHSPVLEQAVLADFINEGHFARHIRRMRLLYAHKQATLVKTAETLLKGTLTVNPAEAGMHLVGWLPENMDDRKASLAAASHGVDAAPLSYYAQQPLSRGGLLLGYAGVEEDDLIKGLTNLQKALIDRRLLTR